MDSDKASLSSAKPARAAYLISLAVPAVIGLYLLLTSTTTLVAGLWPYDVKRMLEFGVLLLLFLTPLLNAGIRDALAAQLAAVPRWIAITLLAVLGLGIVSALVNAQSAMHAANSLSEVALLTSLVLAVFVVAACRRIGGRNFDRVAIALLALTGLVVGVQELLGVLAAHASGVDFTYRISLLHFSWPRFYNQVQSWMVPALAALPLLFSRSRLAQVLCVLVLGLQWYIILVTGARGSFVALAAATAFVALLLPYVRKHLLGWQAGGLLLGGLLYAMVLLSFEKDGLAGPGNQAELARQQSETPASPGWYGNEDDNQSRFLAQSLGRPMINTSGRTWMWRVAWRDTIANPLLGIGPMNYACTGHPYIGHPHNFLLQLSAEWGLPVAIAVLLMALTLLWRITMNLRQGALKEGVDQKLAALLLAGVCAAGIHAGLSGVMVMPASQATGVLLCGMLLGLHRAHPATDPGSFVRWLALPAALLATCLLVLGVHELRTMEDRAALLEPGEDMRPRIWQNAKVCQFYTRLKSVND